MGSQVTPVDFSTFGNVIDGSLRSSKIMHQGVNPSDLSKLWDVPVATSQDLDDAVEAAQKSFTSWSKTPWESRQKIVSELHDLLQKHRDEFKKLIILEGGKPEQFAALEVEHAAGFLAFQASQEPLDEVIQDDDELQMTLRFIPIGVVGAITPWNFPLVLSIAKIGAALITGNCVIVKPSPFTPYTILKFIEIAQQILPAGVLQALNGDDMTGPLMTQHPGIGKITFTGSTATGKKIMEAASKTLKNITLELGGNSATIICPDVNIQAVAPQIALGSFFNSGQFCMASKRIYVHEDIYPQFLEALTAVVKSWKVGPTSEQGLMLGPVQNEMQYNIVRSFFEDSAKNGYKFALGGELEGESGFVIRPGIVDNPPDSSKIVREEPFGPIVPVLSWSTEEEVISRVNDTSSGLGGAVWSTDLEKAQRLGRQIEAGTIWINSFEKPLPHGYFAGHKESGVGGEWGRHGLYAYCNAQCMHLYKS